MPVQLTRLSERGENPPPRLMATTTIPLSQMQIRCEPQNEAQQFLAGIHQLGDVNNLYNPIHGINLSTLQDAVSLVLKLMMSTSLTDLCCCSVNAGFLLQTKFKFQTQNPHKNYTIMLPSSGEQRKTVNQISLFHQTAVWTVDLDYHCIRKHIESSNLPFAAVRIRVWPPQWTLIDTFRFNRTFCFKVSRLFSDCGASPNIVK